MNEPLDTKTANRLATGAPGTITLAGQTYLIAQPTKADFVTLRKELARQWQAAKAAETNGFIASVVADVKGLSPDVQRIAIEAAVKTTRSKAEPTPSELEELLLSKSGVAFWAWLLIRKLQPSVAIGAIQEAITDDNVDEICGAILDANGLKESLPN